MRPAAVNVSHSLALQQRSIQSHRKWQEEALADQLTMFITSPEEHVTFDCRNTGFCHYPYQSEVEDKISVIWKFSHLSNKCSVWSLQLPSVGSRDQTLQMRKSAQVVEIIIK